VRDAVILPSRRSACRGVADNEERRLVGGARIGSPEGASDSGAHLVEAVGAIHGPVVARKEGHKCLSAALGANGRVHFSLSPVAAPSSDAQSSVLLGDGSAALTSLRLVDQSLAGVELLLAR